MQHLGNLKAAIKLNWKPIFSLQRLHNKPVLLLASKWMHRNNKNSEFSLQIYLYTVEVVCRHTEDTREDI